MKIKIIDLLINEGYFNDKKEATSWIMLGKVFANEQKILSCGEKVKSDAKIFIKDYDMKYVSKGGYKLEGALKDFNIDVSNKVCLDAGASTGGFTDCLLQHGAKMVYAVDVGFGQLRGKLSTNPKVINLEKTNISDEKLLALEIKPELTTIDLSYLSLKDGIPICAKIMNNQGIIIALVKPLFEVDSKEIRRTGIINNEKIYFDVLDNLIDYIHNELDFNVFSVTNSTVTGSKGTKEFFLGISVDKSMHRIKEEKIISEIAFAVKKAMEL